MMFNEKKEISQEELKIILDRFEVKLIDPTFSVIAVQNANGNHGVALLIFEHPKEGAPSPFTDKPVAMAIITSPRLACAVSASLENCAKVIRDQEGKAAPVGLKLLN